ncbi:unnamed protein product [Cunninghamella blakesleeana]
MVLKSTLLFTLAIVQLAVGSSIEILHPKPKTVWQTGQVVKFQWKSADSHSNSTNVIKSQTSCNKKVSIALAAGPAQSLLIERVIASNVNACKGSYSWKIPKQFDTTKKYVVEIGPSANDIAFAGYVTIKKSSTHKKPTPTTTPTKTNTPTSTPTTTPTKKKHEPTSVCVVVPNKNGNGNTVKCHPKPSKKKSSQQKKKPSHPKKKKDQPKKKKNNNNKKPTPTPTSSSQTKNIATPAII